MLKHTPERWDLQKLICDYPLDRLGLGLGDAEVFGHANQAFGSETADAAFRKLLLPHSGGANRIDPRQVGRPPNRVHH
jgi:hypothetical protein